MIVVFGRVDEMRNMTSRIPLHIALYISVLAPLSLISLFDAPKWTISLSTIAISIAATAIFVSVARRKVDQLWAWGLIGMGVAAWALGDGVWNWYELAADVPVPFPSFADVGYLGAVPFLASGLFLLARIPHG